MRALSNRSIWFSRFVLGAASLLFLRISVDYMTDPVGAVSPQGITLGSADAMTIMRCSGSVFLAIAITLLGCLASERRLLVGLGFLATVAISITSVRLLGLAIDGPGPFTLRVLKPEVLMVVLSTSAFFLERRRHEFSTN